MAELDDTASPGHNLLREVGSSTSPPVPQKPAASLLPKAAFLAAIAVLLPLFPSQAPEFFSETLLTRSWELIHLVLVGIAISYGLFSSRNAGGAAEKELPCKSGDSPQSYVSELLQVSPVFNDDDGEIHGSHPHRSKLQMWTSQYNGEDSTVLVAEDGGRGGGGAGRLLLLPVRSLKGVPGEKAEPAGDAVLASPIPWRSRSQRMEMETTPPFRRPSSSPRTLSPSSSASLEPKAISGEGSWKKQKKNFHQPPPPPPTPPPPPRPSFFYKPSCCSSDGKESLRDCKDGSRSSNGCWNDRIPLGRSVRTVRPKETLPETETAAAEPNPTLAPPVSGGSPVGEHWPEEDEVLEGVVVSASEDSDGDDSDLATPEENEVDKKADEFIAKFREQIRLQRIENMKRSSAGKGGSGSRRNP
ncbi:unnamed protein product [Spirodela intermedia]|uniref:Uncharacterized protein n=1 Tax=Spirodela intermedia TaxID=51605 RepID=A0A7I8K452_SPIIN|nr:unnamed protein product [Spirodela intermedia]